MKKRGFTLIEIMVVIAIMGILAMMIMGNFKASQQKARDIKRKSDISQMGKALELYNNDFGRYPLANSGVMKGCGVDGLQDCAFGTSALENQNMHVIYMAKLPQDPVSGMTYYYVTDASGTYYQLYARLENPDDKDKIPETSDPVICVASPVAHCNFGLSSTNTTP